MANGTVLDQDYASSSRIKIRISEQDFTVPRVNVRGFLILFKDPDPHF